MTAEEPEFVFSPVHVTELVQEGEDIYENAITVACDFCLDVRVEWEYPCERFMIDDLKFGSDGNWLACERCAKHIEARAFGNLAVRSVHSLYRRGGSPSPDDVTSMGRIQHGFFDHRSGPRFAYETKA